MRVKKHAQNAEIDVYRNMVLRVVVSSINARNAVTNLLIQKDKLAGWLKRTHNMFTGNKR